MDRSPGLTFGVDDIFDVAGYPTSCGNTHKLDQHARRPHERGRGEGLGAAGWERHGMIL